VKTNSYPSDVGDRFDAADRIHSAAIHLLRHAAQRDVLSGQGPARLSALSVLVFGGPKTLGELAAVERVKPPTMSRVVAGLKNSGLIKISADASDARRVRISATAKGERLLQVARKRRLEALVHAFGSLNESDVKILVAAAEIVERAIRLARR